MSDAFPRHYPQFARRLQAALLDLVVMLVIFFICAATLADLDIHGGIKFAVFAALVFIAEPVLVGRSCTDWELTIKVLTGFGWVIFLFVTVVFGWQGRLLGCRRPAMPERSGTDATATKLVAREICDLLDKLGSLSVRSQ